MIENNETITTDTEGIYMRNYEDTLVTREIPNTYGYYNEAGEYVENGTFTITHYQYAHNPMELYRMNENQEPIRLEDYEAPYFEQAHYKNIPMELYEANQNQPAVRLEDYEAPYFEQALYKGIPMMYRFNPTIRNMMMTGNYRIRYRGGSKPQYGYQRSQYNTLAEYADTFAIYPK